ncbi:MAG TPA: FkbM family methyltransferase [Thermoleophilaceae bacterium]
MTSAGSRATGLLRRAPGGLQRALRLAYVGAFVTSDLASLRTYARLSAVEFHRGRAEQPVDLRLRALGGRAVAVRPSTSDIDTVWGTFARRYHRAPPELGEPALILDLGANIGLTMADFAARHPRARVVGVELDDLNVALARRNVAPWGDRCQVVHAAVWPEDGEVWYDPWPGGTATYRASAGDRPGAPRVPALSLATLVREHGPVDYLKMDVEGAERELLQDGTGWASRVKAIKVELHEPYTTEDCEADLRRLGFDTRVDTRHWACVVGVRA